LLGGEERILALALAFLERLAQDRDRLAGERGGPPFPPFAFDLDVRPGGETDVGDPQRDELGDAHAGQDHREQQRVVGPSEPC
jgi:hypothetical protein